MPEAYARKFSRYGLPKEDLVNEGVIGIMHALDKFDLKKNLRLATYASWWIRAAMQDYILKNWSIVRMASTAKQKSLFFGLNRIKKLIAKSSNNIISDIKIDDIAKSLKVKDKIVIEMESKLALGDKSLNENYSDDSNNDLLSNLPDNRPNPEDIVAAMKDNKSRAKWLYQALDTLSNREREIVSRKLYDKTLTLEKISNKIGVSKERVRQIENRAYQKLNRKILSISGQDKDFFIN